MTASEHETDGDTAARTFAVLARAEEIAREPLEGIEEAAYELAEIAAGDLRVIERARRQAIERAATFPDRITRQVVALLRRALEVGSWSW